MIGSVFDIEVAARTLCQEARGEPVEGQTAVAWTLKNRLAAGRWGHALSSVCLWHAQYSGWSNTDPNFAYACGLQDDDPMLKHMRQIMSSVLVAAEDPTDGAMFYYATSMPKPPYWVDESQFCGQWGHQRFYRGTK